MPRLPSHALPALLPLLAALGSPRPAGAQAWREELAVELFAGTAWHLPMPLVVRRPGDSAIRIRARYETRPLADAPYYAYRLGRQVGGRGAEAELVHHKLYLADPRPPIERFEVTHGYNLVMANGIAPAAEWRLRLGIGLVVAHPEGRIAGAPVGGGRTLLGGGYHIAGGALQLAVGRRWALGRGETVLVAAPEVKLTAAMARVPAGAGRILVPDVSLHALGGLGVVRRAR